MTTEFGYFFFLSFLFLVWYQSTVCRRKKAPLTYSYTLNCTNWGRVRNRLWIFEDTQATIGGSVEQILINGISGRANGSMKNKALLTLNYSLSIGEHNRPMLVAQGPNSSGCRLFSECASASCCFSPAFLPSDLKLRLSALLTIREAIKLKMVWEMNPISPLKNEGKYKRRRQWDGENARKGSANC